MKNVLIDAEMKKFAKKESQRRDAYIEHHFEVNHLNYSQRDELGFLGEFACCKLFKIDWKKNIRANYLTIDDYDFIVKGLKVDVKTETVPLRYAKKILERTIDDDKLYGRRLINKNQLPLLTKYDIVIFSLFIRNAYSKWYPIGYLETEYILKSFKATKQRPDGGYYPFSAAPVKTSALKNIEDLL